MCPIFFKSLKQTVGIAKTASNYKVLSALGMWHPKYVSVLQFVKSAIKLMRQYDGRDDFAEHMPQVAKALAKIEEQLEQEIEADQMTTDEDVGEITSRVIAKLDSLNFTEVMTQTLPPPERERILGQISTTAHHQNIFQGGENGAAILRFLTNRTLNLRRWREGSHNYDECVYCKRPATQDHFLLECWATKGYAGDFFSEVKTTLVQLLPKKKHGHVDLTNRRLLDLVRF